MPIIKCKICGKEFYSKPSWSKRGWGKYCSMDCKREAQLTGQFLRCEVCGKKIWRTPSKIKRSQSGKFFCSKSCFMHWKNRIMFVGEEHPNWTGGESAGRGILERSGRKIKCKLCNSIDKRVLVVHHKDGNRKNNEVANLIWLCHNCHHLVHCYRIDISK